MSWLRVFINPINIQKKEINLQVQVKRIIKTFKIPAHLNFDFFYKLWKNALMTVKDFFNHELDEKYCERYKIQKFSCDVEKKQDVFSKIKSIGKILYGGKTISI